jgi:predicted alpha/beta-hydrolase family hydrolase
MLEWTFEAGRGPVSASLHGEAGPVLVLGHGAGGHRKVPRMLRLAQALARGRRVILFNFPYSEAGRRVPDRPPLLEAAWRAVIEQARALGPAPLAIGGHSMGGRIASQVAAAGEKVDALVLLSYPLHPPGRRDRLRDAHLPAVSVPLLFVRGTRDTFSDADLFEAVIGRLGERATVLTVADGDHSLAVRRSSGRTTAQAEAEVVSAVHDWLDRRGL